MDYFSRNIGTLSLQQQDILQQKTVSVVGCGGLGGYVVELLVRLGTGSIHCFDPDLFAPSNCNRQLYACLSSLGRNKAEVAVDLAGKIHGQSELLAFPIDYRKADIPSLYHVDAVVDCLDDIPARIELARYCSQHKVKLVHGSVAGWHGQVGVQVPGGDLYDKLYPSPAAGGLSGSPSVLACSVSLVASIQTAEILKLLLDMPSKLINSCLFIDAQECEFTSIL